MASIEEVSQVFSEIEQHPARSAAVMACTYAETGLRYAISTKFVLLDPNYFGSLMDPPGPMSSLYSMIELGFALGLYGPLVQADFHTIRRIRNGFAHTLGPISFATHEVTEETKMLRYLDWLKTQAPFPITEDRTPTLHDLLMNDWVPWPDTERKKYVMICRLFTDALIRLLPDQAMQMKRPSLLP